VTLSDLHSATIFKRWQDLPASVQRIKIAHLELDGPLPVGSRLFTSVYLRRLDGEYFVVGVNWPAFTALVLQESEAC